MAKTKKAVPKKAATKEVKEVKEAGKVVTIKDVAQSIAGLSHEDRVKLHKGFTTQMNRDNENVSIGKIPDGSNYAEWVKTFE